MRNFCVTFTAIIAVLLCGVSPAAANQRFLPSGINAVSPTKAKSQVLDYASLNDEYADLLARETGASEFNRKDYKSKGYSKAKAGTANTSLTSSGAIHSSSGAVGTKTLVLVNIRTKRKVEIMVRCANIRKGGKCDCKPVTVRKINKILVNKKFSKVVKHTCPSGQTVTVNVSGNVKGWVKGTVTAKVIGSAKIYLNQQIHIKVTAQVSVACDEMPAPAPAPTPTLALTPDPFVQADGSPAHLYTNGNAVVFFRTSKGAMLNVTTAGPVWVSGLREITTTWNKAACPQDSTCWEARVWAQSTPGQATVMAKATQFGKEATTQYQFPVVADQF